MNIPIHALVRCKDGDFGHVTCLVMNPINDCVTHFVVNDRQTLGWEHLVPASWVIHTSADSLTLNCDRADVAHQPDFIEYHFDRLDEALPYREDHIYWPVLMLEHELPSLHQVPFETLPLWRGMFVYAAAENFYGEKTDQVYYGHIESFVAHSQTGRATHVIVHEALSHRSVAVTMDHVHIVRCDIVNLDLTRNELSSLPDLALKPARKVYTVSSRAV